MKSPHAYNALPDTASASTSPFIPEPSADQLLPFHCAMALADTPPAVAKLPPAYNVLSDTASASTLASIPEPRADQLLPFHCAMELADTPPAIVK